MRFVPVVDKHGTHELPDMFYEGVMFGISHGNSHNVEVQCVLIADGFHEFVRELWNGSAVAPELIYNLLRIVPRLLFALHIILFPL